MKPKLTPKQAKFVQALAEGKSGTQAALIAYDVKTPEAAAQIAYENVRKLDVQEAIKVMMDAKGLSSDKLLDKLHDGLDATKWNDFTGENAPDFQVRHKYLETALRLKGLADVNVKHSGTIKHQPILGGASVEQDDSDR